MKKTVHAIRLSDDCEKILMREFQNSEWGMRLSEFVRILFIRGLIDLRDEQDPEKKNNAIRFAAAVSEYPEPKPETSIRANIIPFPGRAAVV